MPVDVTLEVVHIHVTHVLCLQDVELKALEARCKQVETLLEQQQQELATKEAELKDHNLLVENCESELLMKEIKLQEQSDTLLEKDDALAKVPFMHSNSNGLSPFQ